MTKRKPAKTKRMKPVKAWAVFHKEDQVIARSMWTDCLQLYTRKSDALYTLDLDEYKVVPVIITLDE